MRVLVEPRLLNSPTPQLLINERAALPAAFPLEARLANERVFLELRPLGALAPEALVVLLGHLSPFGLTFLDNVHPYLHSQILLMLAKLVVQWLGHGDPLGRYLLLQSLISAKVLVDHASCQVLLRLLHAVDALRMVRRLEGGLRGATGERWADIIFHPSSYLHPDRLVLRQRAMILGCARGGLLSLHEQLVSIWIGRQGLVGVDRDGHSRCSSAMHHQSFRVVIIRLMVLLFAIHSYNYNSKFTMTAFTILLLNYSINDQ